MKKIFFLLPGIVLGGYLGAQNEANHWYFGTYAGLDFSGGAPVAVNGPMTTTEGTASVSTASGQLLFYTNGVDIYDSTHTIMPNGSGLMGDVSTTQSALIVPNPANAMQYYVFTAAADGGANGFRYSIVDMVLNGGQGDVTGAKNILLTDSVTEKICAIKDRGNNQYWIVTHKWGSNEFYAYLLTSSGLQPPVVSMAGTVHSTTTFQNCYGQMKFNMCGDKIAVAIGYQKTVELFDFDLNTGMVSTPITLLHGDNVYGVEFSPSSEFLYTTGYDVTVTLAQFNITSGIQSTILASKVPLSITSDLYGLQIGPDKKIYVSRSFVSSYVGVIGAPDSPGFACNYADNAIDLDPNFMGYNGALSLPSFPQNFLSANIVCSGPTGAEEKTESVMLKIFPNPSGEEFFIETKENISVFVYDITGKLIETIPSGKKSFGKNYLSGAYVAVVSGNGYCNKIVLVKE
ncbi:MAG: T9SS type A sorting domain-containing protein [Bacteroidota bacterium]